MCLTTVVSRQPVLAALAMAVVGFAVLFVGVVSSELAGASTALLLASVLPVFTAPRPGASSGATPTWWPAGTPTSARHSSVCCRRPLPTPAAATRDGASEDRLVDAVRRARDDRPGTASPTALRMIWTGDHLDALRRLQPALLGPAADLATTAPCAT